jgi:hypothetical protein
MLTLIYLLTACGAPGAAPDSSATLDSGDTAAPVYEAVRPSEADGIFCLDNDGDGWGDGRYGAALCGTGPHDGWARIGDCDDYLAAVHPGAAEVYDGMDNDCDGEVDE